MANSADPDQLASSEANWSGSTLFAKTVYPGSPEQRLICHKNMIWYSLEVPHNICFHGEIRKVSILFSWKLELWLRPWSAWASAQSDQGLHSPLKELLDAIECINQRLRLRRPCGMCWMIWMYAFFISPKMFLAWRDSYKFNQYDLSSPTHSSRSEEIFGNCVLLFCKITCCGFSSEGVSDKYPQHMFPQGVKKNINTFWLKKTSIWSYVTGKCAARLGLYICSLIRNCTLLMLLLLGNRSVDLILLLMLTLVEVIVLEIFIPMLFRKSNGNTVHPSVCPSVCHAIS